MIRQFVREGTLCHKRDSEFNFRPDYINLNALLLYYIIFLGEGDTACRDHHLWQDYYCRLDAPRGASVFSA